MAIHNPAQPRMDICVTPYWQQMIWGRYLLYTFFSKQIKIRYQKSFLGFFWSLLNPAMTMAIYAVVFSVVFRVQMEAYVVYLMTSLFPYSLFSQAVRSSADSLVVNACYYQRYYLPKMVFPVVEVGVALFDFLTAYFVLFGIGYFFGFRLSWAQLVVPLCLVNLAMMTLGCSLIASILGVYFGDFKHIVSVVLQALLFATPVLYPVEMVPPQYQYLLKLNPLYFFVQSFSLPLYYHKVPPLHEWFFCTAIAFAALAVGLVVFRKYESGTIFRI